MIGEEIDKIITAHYRALDRIRVVVPEWGNLEIYATPVTLAEEATWADAQRKPGLEWVARAIIAKAQREDGTLMFTIANLQTLLRSADAAVVKRVGAAILRTDADVGKPGESPQSD